MIKRISLLLQLIVVSVAMLASVSLTGSGTATDPYLLGTYDELMAFANTTHSTDAITTYISNNTQKGNTICGKLTRDITANISLLNDYGELNTAPTGGWWPWSGLGESDVVYIGTFDGDGFSVSGLCCDFTSKDGNAGFVRYLGTNGIVKNLIVKDSYFKTNTTGNNTNYAGGICAQSDGVISNCASYVTVINGGYVDNDWQGNGYAGGICGYSEKGTTISRCYSIPRKIIGDKCGSILGYSESSSINYCFSSYNIIGLAGTGSVVTYESDSRISDNKDNLSFSSGEVTYLLNTGRTDDEMEWKQTLFPLSSADYDYYPTLTSTHKHVYYKDRGKTSVFVENGKLATVWDPKTIMLRGGLKAYSVASYNAGNNSITLEEVNPADTQMQPLILRATGDNCSYDITQEVYFNIPDETGMLLPAYEGLVIGSTDYQTCYLLQTKTSGQKFYPIEKGSSYSKCTFFRCYLSISSPSGAKSSPIEICFDDEPTGVNHIASDTNCQEENVYNVLGQRLNNTDVKSHRKGIYIIKGKKYTW